MGEVHQLTTEERARIEEIQDLLIEQYVALKDAYDKAQNVRTREIEHEINELHREIEKIKEWAKA